MKARGFTLVEILIALAIVAVAIAAAMRAAALATDSAADTRLRTYANWAAQNRIAELTARRAFPDAGTETGETEVAGVKFTWQQQTVETPNREFRKVQIDVTPVASTHRQARVTVYLARSGT
jgi:general secretion pathway protein I